MPRLPAHFLRAALEILCICTFTGSLSFLHFFNHHTRTQMSISQANNVQTCGNKLLTAGKLHAIHICSYPAQVVLKSHGSNTTPSTLDFPSCKIVNSPLIQRISVHLPLPEATAYLQFLRAVLSNSPNLSYSDS